MKMNRLLFIIAENFNGVVCVIGAELVSTMVLRNV
jgi:hypothetical protein